MHAYVVLAQAVHARHKLYDFTMLGVVLRSCSRDPCTFAHVSRSGPSSSLNNRRRHLNTIPISSHIRSVAPTLHLALVHIPDSTMDDPDYDYKEPRTLITRAKVRPAVPTLPSTTPPYAIPSAIPISIQLSVLTNTPEYHTRSHSPSRLAYFPPNLPPHHPCTAYLNRTIRYRGRGIYVFLRCVYSYKRD